MDVKADNALYRSLRAKACPALWSEDVAAFDRLVEPERTRSVGVIRAVGVAFAERGTTEEKARAVAWLNGLLGDPSEKVRRYAMAALPKLGDDAQAEARLLGILAAPAGERERQKAAEALEKIGGEATLQAALRDPSAVPVAPDRVAARAARQSAPGDIQLDRALSRPSGVRIHLHCRRGLERILADEARVLVPDLFTVKSVTTGLVAVEPLGPFTLGDLHRLRCFAQLGFVLGDVRATSAEEAVNPLALRIASARTRDLLAAFTDGAFRYRIEMDPSLGDSELVRRVAAEVHRFDPSILNDAREAPWSVDVFPAPGGATVELRPRLSPDPRLAYRQGEVAAGSHPPLAAAMARLAGPYAGEVVWDPFCGSGVELVERALLGGVARVIGTDLSAEAVEIARKNFESAAVPGVRGSFVCADFREFAKLPELGLGTVSLVLTNPPMGRRIPIADMRGLIVNLFNAAARALRPGGRLVFPNPLKIEAPERALRLVSRGAVDLGGFDCQLEMWVKE